jgi:hypothetical protein
MLVLLAPTFSGSNEAYVRLAQLTGLLAYDLRARLKPGNWGMVRALADHAEASRLTSELVAADFPAVVVDRAVAHDSERRILALSRAELEVGQMVLHLGERVMPVPYSALCCIVRGEVQLGRGVSARSYTPGTSSSTFRAVVPNAADLQVSLPPAGFEAFAAADLHFQTVNWIARVDARSFDFSVLPVREGSKVADLDEFADHLAQLAGVRVDRSARSSSVASFTQQAGTPMRAAPAGGAMSSRERDVLGDERFDPYSRIIGEAERAFAEARARGLFR